MLISDKTFNKIDKIISRYIDSIIVFVGGKKSVSASRLRELYKYKILTADMPDEPIINKAYWIGKLTKNHGMTVIEAERALASLISKMKGQMLLTEKAALELAGSTIVRELEKHKEVVKNVVNDLLLAGNYTYRNATATPQEALESALLRKESISKITSELRQKSGDLYRNWKRVAVTEATNTMNAGAVDQIVRENKGKSSSDIYCFKDIPLDFSTCSDCKRVYLDGMTPKVYPLSELISNGTNVGRKKGQLLAVVGSTHPNCRGKLVELPPGWGFEKGSSELKYFGPDFLWYRDKNKNIE